MKGTQADSARDLQEKRDLFALVAMLGILANPGVMVPGYTHNMVAEDAYRTADAMMKARGPR